mmetsp:Transcript_53103/g.164956  ORF Transcript_53103/g.164956 Transcript_53103/m.164956 type:complete len:456 (+) Transcript_53103:1230-2597(+)
MPAADAVALCGVEEQPAVLQVEGLEVEVQQLPEGPDVPGGEVGGHPLAGTRKAACRRPDRPPRGLDRRQRIPAPAHEARRLVDLQQRGRLQGLGHLLERRRAALSCEQRGVVPQEPGKWDAALAEGHLPLQAHVGIRHELLDAQAGAVVHGPQGQRVGVCCDAKQRRRRQDLEQRPVGQPAPVEKIADMAVLKKLGEGDLCSSGQARSVPFHKGLQAVTCWPALHDELLLHEADHQRFGGILLGLPGKGPHGAVAGLPQRGEAPQELAEVQLAAGAGQQPVFGRVAHGLLHEGDCPAPPAHGAAPTRQAEGPGLGSSPDRGGAGPGSGVRGGAGAPALRRRAPGGVPRRGFREEAQALGELRGEQALARQRVAEVGCARAGGGGQAPAEGGSVPAKAAETGAQVSRQGTRDDGQTHCLEPGICGDDGVAVEEGPATEPLLRAASAMIDIAMDRMI